MHVHYCLIIESCSLIPFSSHRKYTLDWSQSKVFLL